MSRFMTRRLSIASALFLGSACLCTPSFGQAQPDNADREAQRNQRMEEFRKQADVRMKELLKASDEEYAVLKPRIEKIQQTQRANDTRRVGMSMLMGNSTWRTRTGDTGAGQRSTNPQPDANAQARRSPFGETPVTPVSERTKELQAALETKDVSNDALKTKLAELRAAKQQAKGEMDKLQEELRSLCSVRQESVLVMMGILE